MPAPLPGASITRGCRYGIGHPRAAQSSAVAPHASSVMMSAETPKESSHEPSGSKASESLLEFSLPICRMPNCVDEKMPVPSAEMKPAMRPIAETRRGPPSALDSSNAILPWSPSSELSARCDQRAAAMRHAMPTTTPAR